MQKPHLFPIKDPHGWSQEGQTIQGAIRAGVPRKGEACRRDAGRRSGRSSSVVRLLIYKPGHAHSSITLAKGTRKQRCRLSPTMDLGSR